MPMMMMRESSELISDMSFFMTLFCLTTHTVIDAETLQPLFLLYAFSDIGHYLTY